jgi:phosphatidylglycerophosphatase C
MSTPALSPHELVARLAVLKGSRREAALAFDADGTLWTGDVGEDVFEAFANDGLLREEARPALAALMEQFGLDSSGDANALGAALLYATHGGFIERLPAYEAMTWGYAGFTVEEFVTRAREAIEGLGMADRLQRELTPVLEWARSERVSTIVVSASPRLVVEAALELSGIAVNAVEGGRPRTENGVIVPLMSTPLPYGPVKRAVALAHVREDALLASFGDSDYDLALLESARLGVLVRPKPGLKRLAAERPSLVSLLHARGTDG